MKISTLLLLSCVTFSYAQNSDTSLISVSNYKLFPGTHSWRGTNTFFDMTSWDSSPYTEGHLRQKNGSEWLFRLNYRLLFPVGYNANYDNGYPLLILLHGAGERGNCWVEDCYCKDCDSNGAPVPNAASQFLNNDHMLTHGGRPFFNAVSLAGNKTLQDPGIDPKAFPGFVFFPQCENTWGSAESSSSAISHAIRTIRLLIKQYNIDPDRVYLTGLSMGGQGVLKALSMADWLFASAIAMSPLSYHAQFDYAGAKDVPIWIFQGANDLNPRPSQSEALVKNIKEAGGTVRYTLYPDAGHNTWTSAFREPEFFPWLLQHKKNDLHVQYNNPFICSTNGEGSQISMPRGFAAYQWERDGAILSDRSTDSLIVVEPGTYRGRFARTANPGEQDWNDWSAPVEIKLNHPEAPSLKQQGTTFLPDLNGTDVALLYSPSSYPYFSWERNNTPAALPDTNRVTIDKGTCADDCSNNGTYSVRVEDLSGCPSDASNQVHVFFSNTAPVVNDMRPNKLNAQVISPSKTFLDWNDASNLESGYEIWRKNTSVQDPKWQLAALTGSNVTFHYDTALIPNSIYHYKIRAINHQQRSDYYPGNSENESEVVTLPEGQDQPSPPQNLKGELKSVHSIKLTWEKGSDESGIKEYVINYNGTSVATGSLDTSFTIAPIEPNKIYNITINTVDISGNTSSPSNQISILTKMSGLFYKHSTGAWKSLEESTMKESWENPEYTGTVSTLSLTPRVQDDYFNFEFEGYINIVNGGPYQFYLNSDDGSRLYIDDVLVIDFDGTHPKCTGDAFSTTCPNGWGIPSSTLALSSGPHRFKVQMFDYMGGHSLRVLYNGPDTYGATIDIPETAYNSGGSIAMNNPGAPVELAAKPLDMKTIELAWAAGSPFGTEYEIYRSTAEQGPYKIINTTNKLTYTDSDLLPSSMYFYKLRTIHVLGVSSFSSVVSTETMHDSQPPSTPGNLIAESGNVGKVILKWIASSDDIGIKEYEVWGNEQLLGLSPVPAYELILPESGEVYTIYVKAVDLGENRSEKSNEVDNEIFVTSIENPYSVKPQVIYPNPYTQPAVKFSVKTKSRGACRLVFSDLTGKILHNIAFIPREDSTIIEVDKPLSEGVYVIHLMQDNYNVSSKMILRNR